MGMEVSAHSHSGKRTPRFGCRKLSHFLHRFAYRQFLPPQLPAMDYWLWTMDHSPFPFSGKAAMLSHFTNRAVLPPQFLAMDYWLWTMDHSPFPFSGKAAMLSHFTNRAVFTSAVACHGLLAMDHGLFPLSQKLVGPTIPFLLTLANTKQQYQT